MYLSTLCYLKQNDEILMLHRISKKNDINRDKWIGVGGKFEVNESPEECMLREVREETGFTLTSWRCRGVITFISARGETEYMWLFTSDAWTGDMIPCDEGELVWVRSDKVTDLNLWEGDRIFLRLLREERPFFLLTLEYDEKDHLKRAVLDGCSVMEGEIR